MTIGRPFQKGQSGNPGGRPKEIAEVKDLAREHMPAAIDALVSIMNNPEASDAARVSAANALLDRGYGKPQQHITGDPISYVAMLPEVANSAEEWLASVKAAASTASLPLDQESKAEVRSGLLLEAKKPVGD